MWSAWGCEDHGVKSVVIYLGIMSWLLKTWNNFNELRWRGWEFVPLAFGIQNLHLIICKKKIGNVSDFVTFQP
jgi:hypothetical protein